MRRAWGFALQGHQCFAKLVVAMDTPPVLPKPKPPLPPGWMWAIFGFGPPVIGALLCTLNAHGGNVGAQAIGGLMGGIFAAIPLTIGLAIAGRLFHSATGQFIGGIAMSLALLCLLGAVLFAGCMCVVSNNGGIH